MHNRIIIRLNRQYTEALSYNNRTVPEESALSKLRLIAQILINIHWNKVFCNLAYELVFGANVGFILRSIAKYRDSLSRVCTCNFVFTRTRYCTQTYTSIDYYIYPSFLCTSCCQYYRMQDVVGLCRMSHRYIQTYTHENGVRNHKKIKKHIEKK